MLRTIAPQKMMRRASTFSIGLTVTMLLAACSAADTSERPERLTLLAHDSFAAAVPEDTFAAFTSETGIEIVVLAAGDAGALVNQAVLTKDNPLADVLFGVDDTFLSRALDQEIFLPHEAAQSADVFPEMIDAEHRVTPVDFGDVCINYDKEWFGTSGLAIPNDLDDLRAIPYASHFTVEHPATSSPGLAFMLATIDSFGEEGWLDYWSDLKAAGVKVVADWDTAYYGEFSRYGGQSGLVVSYGSSPPAEVIFAESPTDIAPTGVIEAGCYRQVEYVGVLAGTEYPDDAGQLVDYMISLEFQNRIPLTWFVYPANSTATLPQEFLDHAVIPTNPSRFAANYVAENRDRWISEWISVMEG